jgi:predicted NBD/HSP70 family sugar kinase
MIVVPAKMGRMNRLALLSRMQRMGTASRADLAKSLGLSQPTCGKIVDDLLRLGVLEAVEGADGNGDLLLDNGRPKLGRPGRMLRLNRTHPRFIGIQLGVTETSLAALPLGINGEDAWTTTFPTPNSAENWVQRLSRAAKSPKCKSLAGVLVSVPGILDERESRVLFSPNLHWTEKVDLAALVRQVWKSPAVLVQEERALALGHQYVTPEHEDFLLVDFGDGVGGAVLVAGKLQASSLPISGELGHTPVRGNARPCGCGAVGCLETLVSMRGLMQSFATAHPEARTAWADLKAHIGQQGVESWLAESLEATAVVIAGALNVIGLRHVVLTGTLAELPPAVMEFLTAAIQRGAMWARFGQVEVEAAPRRRTAGLVAVGMGQLILGPATRPAKTVY